MILSNCCFKPASVYRPPVDSYMDSPPDPVEYCAECGQECEPIDHDCPAVDDPWEAQCDVFADFKFYCLYTAIPFLDERKGWPPCPWQNEV